jgi:hypothetical protein
VDGGGDPEAHTGHCVYPGDGLGHRFDVRQVGYRKTKRKAESEDPLFEFVACRVFRSAAKLDHVMGSHFEDRMPFVDPTDPTGTSATPGPGCVSVGG